MTFFAFNMRLRLPLRQRTTVIGIRRFAWSQGRSPTLLKGPIRSGNTLKDYVYRTTFAALSPRESVVTNRKGAVTTTFIGRTELRVHDTGFSAILLRHAYVFSSPIACEAHTISLCIFESLIS
jgi:hypothetical protein